MSTTATTRERARGPVTLSAWAGRSVHEITLFSGAVVKVRFPDLSRLIRNDTLPEGLRALALRQAFDDLELAAPIGEDAGTGVEARHQAELERFRQAQEYVGLLDGLLVEMLVEPAITLEQIDQIPGEDRDLLLAIAQRQRFTDALGVRLGVAPLDAFREFRQLHGCEQLEPPGCEACQALQQQFSTADLGGV